MTKLASWLAGPIAVLKRLTNRFESWRDIRRQKRLARMRMRAEQARLRSQENKARRAGKRLLSGRAANRGSFTRR